MSLLIKGSIRPSDFSDIRMLLTVHIQDLKEKLNNTEHEGMKGVIQSEVDGLTKILDKIAPENIENP